MIKLMLIFIFSMNIFANVDRCVDHFFDEYETRDFSKSCFEAIKAVANPQHIIQFNFGKKKEHELIAYKNIVISRPLNNKSEIFVLAGPKTKITEIIAISINLDSKVRLGLINKGEFGYSLQFYGLVPNGDYAPFRTIKLNPTATPLKFEFADKNHTTVYYDNGNIEYFDGRANSKNPWLFKKKKKIVVEEMVEKFVVKEETTELRKPNESKEPTEAEVIVVEKEKSVKDEESVVEVEKIFEDLSYQSDNLPLNKDEKIIDLVKIENNIYFISSELKVKHLKNENGSMLIKSSKSISQSNEYLFGKYKLKLDLDKMIFTSIQ